MWTVQVLRIEYNTILKSGCLFCFFAGVLCERAVDTDRRLAQHMRSTAKIGLDRAENGILLGSASYHGACGNWQVCLGNKASLKRRIPPFAALLELASTAVVKRSRALLYLLYCRGFWVVWLGGILPGEDQ